MSRKDFELIAATIKQFNSYGADKHKALSLAALFADALRGTNANFNRRRFLEACGVEMDSTKY